MDTLYLEDQAQFYKEKITHREQLDKAVEIEDRRRWAESPDLETPKFKKEKRKFTLNPLKALLALRP